MQNRMITDVFFDLDHTLWDFDRNSELALRRVFTNHQIELNVSDFIKVYEPINLQYWRMFRKDLISKDELRRGRLIETFDFFNMKFPLAYIDSLAKSYIEELPVDNHLFSGTLETLGYLSNKYNLHIITNGFQEVQHLKLKNSGIAKYFNTITTSEEAGVKKPHHSIFKLAMAKASVLPYKSIMVGDSLEADIFGAKAVGMNTLFFNYRNEKMMGSESFIKNLVEIRKHL